VVVDCAFVQTGPPLNASIACAQRHAPLAWRAGRRCSRPEASPVFRACPPPPQSRAAARGQRRLAGRFRKAPMRHSSGVSSDRPKPRAAAARPHVSPRSAKCAAVSTRCRDRLVSCVFASIETRRRVSSSARRHRADMQVPRRDLLVDGASLRRPSAERTSAGDSPAGIANSGFHMRGSLGAKSGRQAFSRSRRPAPPPVSCGRDGAML